MSDVCKSPPLHRDPSKLAGAIHNEKLTGSFGLGPVPLLADDQYRLTELSITALTVSGTTRTRRNRYSWFDLCCLTEPPGVYSCDAGNGFSSITACLTSYLGSLVHPTPDAWPLLYKT